MLYILKGNPIPLARARTSYVLRRCYDSQKMQKLLTGLELQKQHGDNPFYKGPLEFECVFYLPMPVSVPKKNLPSFINKYHTSRPDTDNLIKYILDVCQGICYDSDAIVCKIAAEKRYTLAENVRTEFEFYELSPNGEKKDHGTK